MSHRADLAVVILAAGKGTRMRSELPKVLHRVCGQSLVERALRSASGVGAKRLVVVVGYGKEEVQTELDRLAQLPEFSSTEIVTAIQSEQNGTGHAAQIGLAEAGDASSILIVPGDTPLLDVGVLEDFLAEASEAAAVTILSCLHEEPAGFGRIIRDQSGAVTAIVERKDCTPEQVAINEINTSFYLASTPFLTEALSQLEPNNAQGELYLTDIIAYGVSKGMQVDAVLTKDVARVSGANTRAELSALETVKRAEINKQLMDSGVTLEDPATTYVDEGVAVGPDTFLGAGTRLKGATVIGSNVLIEGNSHIVNSTVGDGTLLRFGSYLTEATVGSNCQIGPFVQLRPQAILHEGVKIGNFVEVKKSELHAGVKANHLSYIGDAEVGSGSNIGAGTIFCNYDGEKKSVSVLGEGVFVGSNSTLVSPVTIGKDAYIGAGSVINKDIPEGALGVGRSRQANKEGWTARRRKQKK